MDSSIAVNVRMPVLQSQRHLQKYPFKLISQKKLRHIKK